jgi:hypothetical protein
MKKLLVATILGVGLWVGASKAASAADFYYIGSSDNDHITILDPSTISTAPGGNKIFHLAEISEFTLWADTGIEVDCIGNRARMISIVTHMTGGDAMDLSSMNSDVNVWHALVTGLKVDGADLVQTSALVCKYPGEKPTGDDVLTFPDFQSILERISNVIEKNQNGK